MPRAAPAMPAGAFGAASTIGAQQTSYGLAYRRRRAGNALPSLAGRGHLWGNAGQPVRGD
jgi:hypothetical protein